MISPYEGILEFLQNTEVDEVLFSIDSLRQSNLNPGQRAGDPPSKTTTLASGAKNKVVFQPFPKLTWYLKMKTSICLQQ